MFDSLLNKKIDERVDERLNELIKSEELFSFRKISDKQAREEITQFIIKNKEEGKTQLSTLDFVLNTKLPAPQVEKILGEFEKEKKIAEVYA